jgi:hypothetical protein
VAQDFAIKPAGLRFRNDCPAEKESQGVGIKPFLPSREEMFELGMILGSSRPVSCEDFQEAQDALSLSGPAGPLRTPSYRYLEGRIHDGLL